MECIYGSIPSKQQLGANTDVAGITFPFYIFDFEKNLLKLS